MAIDIPGDMKYSDLIERVAKVLHDRGKDKDGKYTRIDVFEDVSLLNWRLARVRVQLRVRFTISEISYEEDGKGHFRFEPGADTNNGGDK